jgi:cobaltochelatase CobS
MSDAAADAGEKIKCLIDGAMVHSIQIHIRDNHKDWSVDRYKKEFPGAPLLSEKARVAVLQAQKQKAVAIEEAKATRKPMHEVFGLPAGKTKNGRGDPIQVRVFQKVELVDGDDTLVPERDDNYVFPIEYTKAVLMAWELNKTIYNWGFHGTGKTTLFEQVAAGTKRPFLRVQHTIGTEESHILGQYIVRDGETKFNLGPLPLAMINGWVYCADEYDAAIPAVSMLYQPVLEKKALYIKDAPPEFRMIRPHANFRFCATGNTNGSGDETGLYQGTQMQNAANYSRFNITIEADYPEPKVEAAIVARQSGVKMADAEKIVGFANEWRKSFKGGQVAMTVSPRELIEAAHQGMILGGNWHQGIGYAFANRLSRTDKEVAKQLAQRIFGNAD